MMIHPWRHIPPEVEVLRVSLPQHMRGATDGRTIWLERRMVQSEARSALAHELVHLHHRHHTEQPPAVERRVHAEAARWLLPDVAVIGEALAWSQGRIPEAADELWVDLDTLQTRLDYLTDDERRHLARRLEQS